MIINYMHIRIAISRVSKVSISDNNRVVAMYAMEWICLTSYDIQFCWYQKLPIILPNTYYYWNCKYTKKSLNNYLYLNARSEIEFSSWRAVSNARFRFDDREFRTHTDAWTQTHISEYYMLHTSKLLVKNLAEIQLKYLVCTWHLRCEWRHL